MFCNPFLINEIAHELIVDAGVRGLIVGAERSIRSDGFVQIAASSCTHKTKHKLGERK